MVLLPPAGFQWGRVPFPSVLKFEHRRNAEPSVESKFYLKKSNIDFPEKGAQSWVSMGRRWILSFYSLQVSPPFIPLFPAKRLERGSSGVPLPILHCPEKPRREPSREYSLIIPCWEEQSLQRQVTSALSEGREMCPEGINISVPQRQVTLVRSEGLGVYPAVLTFHSL